jgi:tRNA (guanosine-2'-O-)-methyltransferase
VAFVPMLGKVGSLNVATATSIALYELRRQAWSDPTTPTTPGGPQT